MEVTLNGFLHESHPTEKLTNGTDLKRLIIRIPSRVNQFGEKIGEENFYELVIFKADKIDEILKGINQKAAEQGLQKMKATCFLNGSQRDYNGKKYYNVGLTVKTITWL